MKHTLKQIISFFLVTILFSQISLAGKMKDLMIQAQDEIYDHIQYTKNKTVAFAGEYNLETLSETQLKVTSKVWAVDYQENEYLYKCEILFVHSASQTWIATSTECYE